MFTKIKIMQILINLFKIKYSLARQEKKHWQKYDKIMKERHTKIIPTDMFGI